MIEIRVSGGTGDMTTADTQDTPPDLGRALLRWFGAGGLTYPYVPDFAVADLEVQLPSTLTTTRVDPLAMYLFHDHAESLLSHRPDTCFTVSYAGHGMNSYAWSVLLCRPGLRLLAQIAFGGAFGDPTVEAESLRELFATVQDIDQEVPQGIQRDVVVLMSDFRDVRATAWAPDSAVDLGSWTSDASSLHPLLALDDIFYRGIGWPERHNSAPTFATRRERLDHEARVMHEWSVRFPEAASGDVDDPEADLALAKAMSPPVDPSSPHSWLPVALTQPKCWWCFGDKTEDIHQ